MPIYEYCCSACGKVSEFLILSLTSPFTPQCPRCGSMELKRLLSRVRVVLSEETRMERLADPHRWGRLADLDENDPDSVRRAMRQMGPHLKEALGEDYSGEMDQMIEEAMETGELGPEADLAGDED
ncbi:MAG: FmdB family zinc ribbon protein [Desulfobaccales bacterium]